MSLSPQVASKINFPYLLVHLILFLIGAEESSNIIFTIF